MESVDDVLGGIKNAMAHGASLKDAMQSFYNAGYKKEDIENAARIIQGQPIIESQIKTSTTIQPQQIQQAPQQFTQPVIARQSQVIQPRLNQNQESSKTGWIILIAGLVIIASLTAILLIFFKQQLIDFFSGA